MSTSARLERAATLTSMKKGGTLIEYEDEDPEVRAHFEATLKKVGMPCQMPEVSR
jgi:hypothetical protein